MCVCACVLPNAFMCVHSKQVRIVLQIAIDVRINKACQSHGFAKQLFLLGSLNRDSHYIMSVERAALLIINSV